MSEGAGQPTSNAQSPSRHPATTHAAGVRYCSGMSGAQLPQSNKHRPALRSRNQSGCIDGPRLAACQFSGLVARSLAVCAHDGESLLILGEVTLSQQESAGITVTMCTVQQLNR